MVWLIILHFGVYDSITTLLVLNATTIHLYLQDKPQKNSCSIYFNENQSTDFPFKQRSIFDNSRSLKQTDLFDIRCKYRVLFVSEKMLL